MTLTISDDAGAKLEIPKEMEQEIIRVLEGRAAGGQPPAATQQTRETSSTGPRSKARSGDDRLYDVVVNGEGAKWPEKLSTILWGYSPKEGLGKVSDHREEEVDRLRRENICRSALLSNRSRKITLSDFLQAEYVWNREYARSRSHDGVPSLLEMLLETHVHQKTEMTTAIRDKQTAADVLKGFFRGGGV